MGKRRIIFVDDQPEVLSGLQRMLRSMRNEWEMEFVADGSEALAAMEDRAFDVIVSDMMMPKMNGAQLLQKVREAYPGTIRYILSGHSDREMALQSVTAAHQFIAKPCEPDELKQMLITSCGLKSLLTTEALHSKIASIDSLPTPPRIYNALLEELQSENGSIKNVAELISQDLGISVKILQLVNSAFFGLPTHVSDLTHAVNLLGLDTIRGLVLMTGVFTECQDLGVPGYSVEGIHSHSMNVGVQAKKVAAALGLKRRHIEDALIAGLLHDVGKLIMLSYFPSEIVKVIELAKEKSSSIEQEETQILGASHSDVGAHLMSLWGLPDPIVEAVAWHHNPSQSPVPTINILTAVHIADAASCHENPEGSFHKQSVLDLDYLDRVGLADRYPELLSLCTPEPIT